MGGMEYFGILYFLLVISVVGFVLSLLYRFVKAFEKIAESYASKNDK